MKKIMLMMAMAVATLTANAQVYVGGGLGFSSNKDAYVDADGVSEPDAVTSFSILPEIGYKLDDKLSVGIQLGFTTTSFGDIEYDGIGLEDVKSTGFSIAPYARYTFVKWGKVGLFADAQFAYSHSTAKGDIPADHNMVIEGKYTENEWSLGIIPGVSFDVNEKISLVTKIGWLGYSSAKPELEAGDMKQKYNASSNFGLNLTNNVEFALFYNF